MFEVWMKIDDTVVHTNKHYKTKMNACKLAKKIKKLVEDYDLGLFITDIQASDENPFA